MPMKMNNPKPASHILIPIVLPREFQSQIRALSKKDLNQIIHHQQAGDWIVKRTSGEALTELADLNMEGDVIHGGRQL